MFSLSLAAVLALGASFGSSVHAKDVFAHMMVGNTASYSQADWLTQIRDAHNAHVDGFALNIANDDYTDAQLTHAYDAAAQSNLPFKLFLSFDYAAGQWDPSTVTSKINAYKNKPAQYKYRNKPLASTFEGPGQAADWASIKEQTGCFFMPDYSSLGPQDAAAAPNVDGLFSWEAWSDGSPGSKVPDGDQQYKAALKGKPYMMPVSPWFYRGTGEPKWVARGDDLWHERWQQVLEAQPEMVEIITWNDWGESSYIAHNPKVVADCPAEAQGYVTPTNHSAWLADLPHYISAYKSGGAAKPGTYGDKSPQPSPKPHLTFWHRLSPGSSCPAVQCNQPGSPTHPSAQECSQDKIFFTVFPPDGASKPASVTVSVGGAKLPVQTAKKAGEIFHGSVGFEGKLGVVSVEVDVGGGRVGPVRGEEIKEGCEAEWNVFVGGEEFD
ncbi:MAG: hypothetical protein M1831_003117 [Alyxoria varia]|nr:MAG: hypothetical protein M1831_003117 [Alyxoria varia]